MPAQHQLPFSRRWPLPMGDPSLHVNTVGPDGIEPPTSSMWARRSTRLSYGPMTATRVMPCRGGGACSTTRPSEPGDRREQSWHARKDSNLRRNPVLEAGALPLSYARLAGEIGIEPMASCASGRCSTHS